MVLSCFSLRVLTHTYTCTHMYTCTHTYTCTHIYTCTHTYIHTQTYIHTHINNDIHDITLESQGVDQARGARALTLCKAALDPGSSALPSRMRRNLDDHCSSVFVVYLNVYTVKYAIQQLSLIVAVNRTPVYLVLNRGD